MHIIPIKYKSIFKDDALDIAQDVIEFANLISKDKYQKGIPSKVYSISAKFGVGKTFFCQKLYRVLQKNNVNCSIFNVWKSDFYNDPLIPILAELNAIYLKSNPEHKSLPDNIIKHRSWWKIGLAGLKLKGELNIPGVGKVDAQLDGQNMVNEHSRQEETTKEEENINIYDEYQAYEQALYDLKAALEAWLSKSRKPIVLIIDELDRCRPDYAVKALEVIKHFFDISGLVFILAIDEEQLANSVKNLFGTTDFDGYKRKFISNSFKLATPDNLKFAEMLYDKSGIEYFIQKHKANHTEVLIPRLCERYTKPDNSYPYHIVEASLDTSTAQFRGAKVYTFSSKEIITRYFASFANKALCNFTLRKQEQVFDRIKLFVQTLKSDYWFVPELIVFLACLHEQLVNEKLFIRFQNRISSASFPREGFAELLDALMPGQSSISANIWKSGWKETEHLRPNMSYFVQKARYIAGGYSQPESEIMSKDVLDLFFDLKNHDNRMAMLGYSGFNLEEVLKTYFSKMEFVSRFSDAPDKDEKLKKSSN